MTLLHRRGVRGYVTLNTLVFPRELDDLEESLRHLVEAGVDAVIVQDLGLVRLIRALTPDLEVHASTQMSITSNEGIRLARELGCSRVILAGELSVTEIARISRNAELPSRSSSTGQLCGPTRDSASPARLWGAGRRIEESVPTPAGCRTRSSVTASSRTSRTFATSWFQDLAAFDLIPELIDLGVASLKIEGRLKAPEYVANITQHYRRAIDAAWAGKPIDFSARDVREMEPRFREGSVTASSTATITRCWCEAITPRNEGSSSARSPKSPVLEFASISGAGQTR